MLSRECRDLLYAAAELEAARREFEEAIEQHDAE